MNGEAGSRTESLDHLSESLRRAGVRLTPQRLEIYRELVARDDHPDAEAIYTAVRERMPSVSLDTVYRTLQLFVNLGLIGTLNPPHERAHYDPNLRPHHHFSCTRCGSVRDFYSDDLDRIAALESTQALGRVEEMHLELRGLCSRCIAAERSA